ncbi:MAG: DNA ligase D [Polaromonas sp.]|nr:DNA ligase D [Polaromonas sp.]
MAKPHTLERYHAKRDFTKTAEPSGADGPQPAGSYARAALRFVVQKHAARNLHYDFRLELNGTLKSWAVPKGPSLDPAVKRMGVQVEDHPLDYAGFEGVIPAKQYGAGEVIVWDHGSWTPIGDAAQGLAQGKLKFELHGKKLTGGWTLVRMHRRSGDVSKDSDDKQPWLLIKEKDAQARAAAEFDVLEAQPDSVITGKPLGAAAAAKKTPMPAKKSASRTAASTGAAQPAEASALPQGALLAPLPATLAPQLASPATRPPTDPAGWLYEIKLDGYRLLTRIDGATVRCFTRNGHDWSARLPQLCASIARLGLRSAWIDGEIVVLNADGLPDFGALQNAFDRSGKPAAEAGARIRYFVFDMPYFDGLDLRAVPLSTRRDILCAAITESPQADIVFSESFDAPLADLLASSRQLRLEGLIGKRADAHYVSRRSPSWIKLKTRLRQEFVIGGYTAPQGARAGLGALLLGVHDAAGKLRYAGNVGTGFSAPALLALQQKLAALHSTKDPFSDLPRSLRAQWVKPQLLAEVAFAEWTQTGRVRHASFAGLRDDKAARQIVREPTLVMPAASTQAPEPRADPSRKRPASSAANRTAPPVRVTHPERVMDAASGVTKQQLVDYYASVSGLLLPHLAGRPVALVRAPDGVAGALFFQKHAAAKTIPGIRLLSPELDPGHAALLVIESLDALLAAAQLNVIELHTWNATESAIRQPDRMTFDLDPGEGVEWVQVMQGAQLVKTLLDELQLKSFIKTSGGKGLHILVPLKPGSSAPDFDVVKDFSHAIVDHLARVLPQTFVAKSGPKNRVGKIFVDYLRNGFGATTASAWSARARPGMGVSVPVGWEELAGLRSGAHWSVTTVAERLSVGNRPWSDYPSSKNDLRGAMRQLKFESGQRKKPITV